MKKEALAQVFSCEFCEISRNTFSCRASPVAASRALSRVSINVVFQQKYHIFKDEHHLFGDAGDITPRCIFFGQGHLCCCFFLGFFCQEGNAMLVTPMHIYRKYHIFTRFLIKIIFLHFPPKEKISYFLEKRNTVFPDIKKKTMFRRAFLGQTIFSEHLKKISYFQVFFEKDHLSLCIKNNIIFSGKRNIIFPDNTRKIIFQSDFFGKIIFSKHLEIENMVLCSVCSPNL